MTKTESSIVKFIIGVLVVAVLLSGVSIYYAAHTSWNLHRQNKTLREQSEAIQTTANQTALNANLGCKRGKLDRTDVSSALTGTLSAFHQTDRKVRVTDERRRAEARLDKAVNGVLGEGGLLSRTGRNLNCDKLFPIPAGLKIPPPVKPATK